MTNKLTPELKDRLVKILVDEGCRCDEEHDDSSEERRTSLNCLASAALHDLESADRPLAEKDTKLKKIEAALNSSQVTCAGALHKLDICEQALQSLGAEFTLEDVFVVLKERNKANERLHEAAHALEALSYKLKCYENWLKMMAAVQHEADIDPEQAVKRLRSMALTSYMVLQDPSTVDPGKFAKAREQTEGDESGEKG